MLYWAFVWLFLKVMTFLYCFSWKQIRQLFLNLDSGQRINNAAANATCTNKGFLVKDLF